jgi:heme o synthase
LFSQYVALTKPGIIRGNAVAALAGFFLASRGNVDITLLIATLGGLSLIIASACVYNNYLDRDIDKLMNRTKNRALASGSVSEMSALIYATILGIIGSLILVLLTNLLTMLIALFGLFAYVIVYGIAKRKTVHGTLVGSISGAVPPVVGYTSVSNQIDTAALLLFLILVCWQMPHFYGIAMYRLADYKKASIPVLPLVMGVRVTKIQILLYILAFCGAALSLSYYSYASPVFAFIMVLLSLGWLILGFRGLKSQTSEVWGRKMFLFSLIVLLVFSISISIDASLA